MLGNMTKTLRTRRHALLVSVLREARKQAGLTQRGLAQKLKWPQSAVAALEKGERRVDVIEFLDIAEACAVAPLEMLAMVVLR